MPKSGLVVARTSFSGARGSGIACHRQRSHGLRPSRTFRMAATKYLQDYAQQKKSIGDDAIQLKMPDPMIDDLDLRQAHMGSLLTNGQSATANRHRRVLGRFESMTLNIHSVDDYARPACHSRIVRTYLATRVDASQRAAHKRVAQPDCCGEEVCDSAVPQNFRGHVATSSYKQTKCLGDWCARRDSNSRPHGS